MNPFRKMNADAKRAYMQAFCDDPRFHNDPGRPSILAYLNAERHSTRCLERAERHPTPGNLRALVTSMELEHEAQLNSCRFVLSVAPWHQKPLIWITLMGLQFYSSRKLKQIQRILPKALAEAE